MSPALAPQTAVVLLLLTLGHLTRGVGHGTMHAFQAPVRRRLGLVTDRRSPG
ncbi:hypothetical protein ACBJ59_55805 [Nonomuraea sp. MTCD27]|uniref:hypothetical protein n=1 Tax=Nonomuraea sp. MTCD27 TaxID=1676747 RepID=UPI0035C267F9